MTNSDQRAAPDNKQAILSLFAERLRYWRKTRGLSRKELAVRAGISEPTIAAYEQGIKTAGIDKVQALSIALGISISELIEETGTNFGVPVYDIGNYRFHKCLSTLEATNFPYKIELIKENNSEIPARKITIYVPDEVSVSGSTETFSFNELGFISVFEEITRRAITEADLTQITVDALLKPFKSAHF